MKCVNNSLNYSFQWIFLFLYVLCCCFYRQCQTSADAVEKLQTKKKKYKNKTKEMCDNVILCVVSTSSTELTRKKHRISRNTWNESKIDRLEFVKTQQRPTHNRRKETAIQLTRKQTTRTHTKIFPLYSPFSRFLWSADFFSHFFNVIFFFFNVY